MVKRLNLDDVVVVGGKLVLASAAEVDALESKLWIKFPAGYREYVERLGEGCLGGTFVRIYPPWRIEKDLVEWRRGIRKYWFWDQSHDLLPKERAVECVVVGDTWGGDRLIFHPCRPDQLFALPHDSDAALEAGSDLLGAIEWMCSSGKLAEAFSEREFEPFDSRAINEEREAKGMPKMDKVVDPEGESLDDVVEMGKRWAARRPAREKHADKMKELGKVWTQRHLVRELQSDNLETEFILEAIVLAGHLNYQEGYMLRYSLIDGQSRDKLGEIQISDAGDPYSSGWYSFFPETSQVTELSAKVPRRPRSSRLRSTVVSRDDNVKRTEENSGVDISVEKARANLVIRQDVSGLAKEDRDQEAGEAAEVQVEPEVNPEGEATDATEAVEKT